MSVTGLDSALTALAGELVAPRRVLFGPGCSELIGSALVEADVKPSRVLVVADRAVASRGLADRLLSGLKHSGLDPIVFDSIDGEPDDSIVDAAAALARRSQVAAIVGVGGGSGMDVAKLVSLLAVNEGGVSNWVGLLRPPNDPLPLALVPTTTGTGGEVTRIAMVSISGAKRIASCRGFVPSIAALDPQLVATLPPAVVASTAFDALAHAVESMLSENRSTFTVAAATRACQLILAHLEPAVLAESQAARGHLLYGAHLAGASLNAGVVLGHSLGYVIARRAHAPHGVTTGLALPYCLAYDQQVLQPIAKHIALTLTTGATDDLRTAATYLESLLGKVGLPRSLEALGIGRRETKEMAIETVRDYPRPNNPVALDASRIGHLLDSMAEGDLSRAWRQMAEKGAA